MFLNCWAFCFLSWRKETVFDLKYNCMFEKEQFSYRKRVGLQVARLRNFMTLDSVFSCIIIERTEKLSGRVDIGTRILIASPLPILLHEGLFIWNDDCHVHRLEFMRRLIRFKKIYLQGRSREEHLHDLRMLPVDALNFLRRDIFALKI